MQLEIVAERSFEVTSKTDLPIVVAETVAFLAENPIVLFHGEMGAGKTTFIKAICEALGVTENVSSPTFSIVNEYRSGNGKPIYHFDFYRLNNEQEALDIGTLEYFESGNICLIEWPSQIPNLLPEQYMQINIVAGEGENRFIKLKTN